MTLETPATPVREFVLRFAPPEQRPALAALLEIEREVLSTARDGLEHSVAHARLAWWEEELRGLARASARHPAARRLADAAAKGGRTPPDLTGLIEVARIDLARVAFLERSELEQYLEDWTTGVFRPLALLGLGATDPRTAAAERYAMSAGPAVREIELLAAVSTHARAGRVFVPLGDPPRPHAPWYGDPLAAPEASELHDRLGALAAALRNASAVAPPHTRAPLAAALTWTTLAVRDAGRACDQLPRALQPTRSEPLRRTIAAWRASVSAARGHLPHPIRPSESA
jgi:phytoene/squalene synthetase